MNRLIFIFVAYISVNYVIGQSHDYALAQHLSTYFYGAQRCGNTSSWCHGSCHLQDGQQAGLNLTGGWHDCGDHIKFSHTGPYTVVALLLGYENFPQAYDDNYSPAYSAPPSNGIPDILDEVKIETDYLLKLLNNDILYYQIGDSTDHGSFSEPVYQSLYLPVSEGGNPRNDYSIDIGGSNICGITSSALALMSIHFRPFNANYADSCLYAAIEVYLFGQSLTEAIPSTSNNGNEFYPAENWADDMALAALELYKCTGNMTYLDDAAGYYNNPDFQVPDWQPLVESIVNQMVHYEFFQTTGNTDYLTYIHEHLLEMYDMQEPCGYMHYADWGSLVYAANTAFVACLYHKQTNDPQAYTFAKSQVDFILGSHGYISADAPANHSFIIGYDELNGGHSQYPHHAAAFGKGANAWTLFTSESNHPGTVPYLYELTGAMVGGPENPCGNYEDNIGNYVSNEVCIYYNAGFVGAVAYINKIENIQYCQPVTDITLLEIGIDSARISWIAPDPLPANGYQFGYSTNEALPVSWNTTSGTQGIFYGLASNSRYYFFVRSLCESNDYSAFQSAGPFYTHTICDEVCTDSGGDSADYSNNENVVMTICPDMPNEHVFVVFSAFEVESKWDALFVFNGNSTSDPKFSSGNPGTNSGFPAGGYYGTNLPGPFTSTHASGCLTFNFMSDESITKDGWEALVSCIPDCNSIVLNCNDEGYGTLRNVIRCAVSGQNIQFSSEISNDTIQLLTPIVIDKNIIISNPQLVIKSGHENYIFEVISGKSLVLNGVSLIGGNGLHQTRVILNRGNLQMTDVNILDIHAVSGDGKTIVNEGIMTTYGNTGIRPE